MTAIQFTKEGFDNLKKEYADLTTTTRPKAIDRLTKARAMGDLSENSEYTAAKEDLAFVEGRVRELEELMKNAEVVESSATKGIVDIGHVVLVVKDGIEEQYTIVGEFEANPMERKLSTTSPIGSALLGKKKGDAVEIEVPAGKLIYKILDIKNA